MSEKDHHHKHEPRAKQVPASPAQPGAGPRGEGDAAADPAPALTAGELEDLRARAAKADEHWDRLLRTTADMENFKKRAARERQEAIRYANAGLLEKLIPALDHFDMALAAAQSAEGNSLDSLKTGIAMSYNQLKAALLEAGLEEIDASDQPFDPTLHEAVSQEDSTEVPEGRVIRQLRKGYKLRDRLLRPASVVVARKPSA